MAPKGDPCSRVPWLAADGRNHVGSNRTTGCRGLRPKVATTLGRIAPRSDADLPRVNVAAGHSIAKSEFLDMQEYLGPTGCLQVFTHLRRKRGVNARTALFRKACGDFGGVYTRQFVNTSP